MKTLSLLATTILAGHTFFAATAWADTPPAPPSQDLERK